MNKAIETQALMRRNVEEQNNALNDFSDWESSIKQNDVVRINKKKLTNSSRFQIPSVSPKKLINIVENGVAEKAHVENAPPQKYPSIPPNSIIVGGHEQVSSNVHVARPPQLFATNSVESLIKSNVELEEDERMKGNALFSTGDYHGAIKHYTRCVQLNPNSVLAISNRAMAYLKLKDWQNAESDSSSAIKLDKLHVKSYQRRSTARLALGKVRASLKDLHLAKEAIASMKKKASLDPPEEKKQKDPTKPCDIKTKHVETELRRIIKHAPKRKIKIQNFKKKESTSEHALVSKDEDRLGTCKDKEKRETGCSSISTSSSFISRHPRKVFLHNVKNWFQFEQHWKSLQNDEKTKYLETIKPSKIIDIYKNGLEDSDLLLDLLRNCSKMKTNGMKYLQAISQITSIDMVMMMLSNEERDLGLKYITESLKYSNKKAEIKRRFGF